MRNLVNKSIAVIVAIVMTMINFMPATVYAAEAIQNASTSQENVEFNATINNSYSVEADIDSELEMNLNLKVSNTGYVKDAVVTIEGANYSVEEDSVQNMTKTSEGYKLNEVNSDEELNASAKLKFKTEDGKINKNDLNAESKIILNAIYVNKEGNEKKITKEFTENVKWTADNIELDPTQELIRYVKFDNKTLVSFKIKDQVKDNKLSVLSKKLVVNIPALGGKNAEEVNVVGESLNYERKNSILTIYKTNNPDENGLIDIDTSNEFIVNVIYDTQVNSEIVNVNTVVTDTLITERELTKTIESNFELNEQVGSIVDLDYEGTASASKGYMLADLYRADKLATKFNTAFKVNVGAHDIIEKLIVNENSQSYTTDSNKINTSLVNSKVSIKKNEFTRLFGEEGTITVKDSNGNEVAVLNKDNTQATITAIGLLSYETTTPVKDGILTINVDRIINFNENITRETINSINGLEIDASVNGIRNDSVYTTAEKTYRLELTNPTSKASIEVEPNSLSTIVTNENVEFDVELKKKDADDALYTNPEIRIELPSQVTRIDLTNASIAYEDELVENGIRVEGNTIIAKLSGTQTKYSEDDLIDGTKITINANIELDNLATSSNEKVRMIYSNEATGETNVKEVEVKVVAPSGFITTHTIETNGQRVTALNDDKEIELQKGNNAYTARVSGRIINNLGNNASGVVIVGRIPAQGNKSLSGNDLGTNVTTALNGNIAVNNINAKVLYSANVNEDVNGNWSEIMTSDTKAFKIVSQEEVAQSKEIDFSYDITIPANLVSGAELKATYGVYYNNEAVEGTSLNLVTSANVGAYVEKDDTITVEVKAYDTNTGREITSNSDVYAGEYITYKAIVKNIAKTKVNNVNVVASFDGYTVPYAAEGSVEDNYLKSNSVNGKYYPARFIKYNETDETKGHSEGFYKVYDYNDQIKAVANINKIKDNNNKDVESVNYVIDEIGAGQSKEVTILARADGYSKKYNINNIKLNINATAQNKKATSNIELKNTENDVYVDLYSKTNGIYKLDQEGILKVFIENISYEESGNLDITVDIPNGLEVTGLEGYKLGRQTDSTTGNYTSNVDLSKYYNKSKNQLKLNSRDFNNPITGTAYETVPARSYIALTIAVKAVKESNTTGAKVTVKSSKFNREIKSNEIDPKTEDIKKVVTIKHEGPDKALDTDKLKYTLTLKSQSNADYSYSLKDYLPEDINVISIAKATQGESTKELSPTNSFVEKDTIKAGSTIVYTIEGTVERMKEGAKKTLTMTPSLTLAGDTIVEVNSVTTVITGTRKDQQPGPGGDIPNPDEPDPSRTYTISGLVWFDANNNGIRDTGEQRSQNNKVRLYNGKDIIKETTVNENGEYEFTDISVGKYYVLISYDNKEYMVTKHQVADATESTDNDFTLESFDGEKLAATAINVTNTNIYNKDLGLATRNNFDFKLDKAVSKITITNSAYKSREYQYVNAKTAKVELPAKNIENTTVVVEYKFTVTNEGRVAGWAKSIVDYLPSGMTFETELNPNWYVAQSGELYCNALANKQIDSGESEEITLYLTRKINGENLGTVRNTAEISELYNVYGYEDADSKTGNKQEDEDDISSADVIILMGTGKETASIIGITLGIVALIGVASYFIKKNVINKMYEDII